MAELNIQQQATRLLTQTHMADLDIKVTLHRSLNSSQGVFSETDLINETDADLLEGLKDQGVMAGSGSPSGEIPRK